MLNVYVELLYGGKVLTRSDYVGTATAEKEATEAWNNAFQALVSGRDQFGAIAIHRDARQPKGARLECETRPKALQRQQIQLWVDATLFRHGFRDPPDS